MDTESIDAKPNATDSSSAGTTDAKPNADSSSGNQQTTQKGGAAQTLEDVVVQAAADSQTAHAEDKSGSTIDPNRTEGPASQGKEEALVDGKPATAPADAKVDAKKDEELPPFHEHPRWKQVTQELQEVKEWKTAHEALVKDQASVVSFCQENAITPAQFQDALDMLRLINSNPPEALKKLQPLMNQLKEFDGETLPKDLEDRVINEEISMDVAKEIAKLRAQTKGQEYQGRIAQQRMQASALQSRQQALDSWEASLYKNDPDYRPKKPGQPDGKFELVQNVFRGLLAQQMPQSGPDAIRLAEQAYKTVNDIYRSLAPSKKPTGKLLPAGTSSTNGQSAPKTMEEAVMAAAARHGEIVG